MHAGPLAPGPRTYWTVEATLRAAGLRDLALPRRGRLTGFARRPRPHARARRAAPHGLGLRPGRARGAAPPLRLDRGAPAAALADGPGLLAGAARDAERTRLPGLPPSTLVHPRYWEEP